ncbi:hypothetical protein J3F83DRAFT_749568 [Trichoderma novae-zelandiae]
MLAADDPKPTVFRALRSGSCASCSLFFHPRRCPPLPKQPGLTATRQAVPPTLANDESDMDAWKTFRSSAGDWTWTMRWEHFDNLQTHICGLSINCAEEEPRTARAPKCEASAMYLPRRY